MMILALANACANPTHIPSGDGVAVETAVDSGTRLDSGSDSETGADSSTETGDPPDSDTDDTGADTSVAPPERGHLEGAVSLGGMGWDDAMSGAVDPDGSRYEILSFQSRIVFDDGGPLETTLVPVGTMDSALVRFDASGDFEWARQLASADVVSIDGVVAMSDGGAAVTGGFTEDVDIAFGDPSHTLFEAAGDRDGYVARFAPDGSLVWAQQFGGEAIDVGADIGVMSDDTVVVAGLHEGDTVVAAGQPEETVLKIQTGAIQAGLVLAFDPEGRFAWGQQQFSTGYGAVYAVAVDASTNEIVVGGLITEENIFGSDQPGEVTIVVDDRSAFLARYDAGGMFLGVVELPGISVADVDMTSDGGVVAAGDFDGETTIGIGEPSETLLATDANQDAWAARFDATGALDWAIQTVSPARKNTVARAIAFDGAGGFVIVGDFTESAVFAGGTATETSLVTGGWYDVFAAHYDPTGQLECVVQISGEETDAGFGVLRMPDGTFEVVDQYMGATVVAGGTPEEKSFTARGESDVLLARYSL